MKIAVCSITHHSVHTPMQVGRHILDWQLQTDDRYFLNIVHDGLAPADWDCAIDCYTEEADSTKYQVSYCEERRKCWGAWNRKDWLKNLDTEKFSHVFFCCADDSVAPVLVQYVLAEFENNPELLGVGFNCQHHHYGYRPIPLGVWPTLNRSDWCSLVWHSDVAKAVGINHPEEFAADGLFHSEVFQSIGNDESKIKIIEPSLVFKN